MPRVMRRTPATEEATAYGYGSLLRDIVGKISRGATREVARMTSRKLSNEELVEMALAPAGGMLKVAGVGKLLAGLLRRQAQHISRLHFSPQMGVKARQVVKERIEKAYHGTRGVFKESLKVPEKEYRRIKDIGWGIPPGRALGTVGEYDPSLKRISLHSGLLTPATIWHEFTHARQYAPGKGEEAAAGVLRHLNQQLAAKSEGGWGEFYHTISPIEEHARNVAITMMSGSKPSEFSRVYLGLLESALKGAETRLSSREVREAWELFLKGKEVL